MKKQMIALAGLAVLSAPAYASKARMSALGQDTDGSFYIEDQRYVFTNPAFFNKFSNFVITEWGTDSANVGTSSPDAEGGFARSTGNFVYSVYLGKDESLGATTAQSVLGSSTLSSGDYLNESNRIELSLAGDAGIQWGATLWHSSAEDAHANGGTPKSTESDSMGLRGGMIMGNIDAAIELDFGGEHSNSVTGTTVDDNDKLERDFGWSLDANYAHGDWTFNLNAKSEEASETIDTGAANSKEYERMTWGLNAGNSYSMGKDANLWWNVGYNNVSSENSSNSVTNEEDEWSIPLNVAFEAKATSWLALRGSVKQNILSSSETTTTGTPGQEDKNTDATTVAAGLSLTFGKLMIDGTVSTTSGDFNLGTDTMGDVAVHYWF